MNRSVGNNAIFRSNGKLMVTGEYLVLNGAESLTLPLKKGQVMKVTAVKGIPSITWTTRINGKYWFEARFSIPDFAIANTNDFPTAQNVRELLIAAEKLNPGFLHDSLSYTVENDLEFNIEWGFGSSSSLINNLAAWAGIDPYRLHFMVSDGSGYDVAAAGSRYPFIYSLKDRKPRVEKTSFCPDFRHRIFFVYTGRKITSSSEVERYNRIGRVGPGAVSEINEITRKISVTGNFVEFSSLLTRHEEIISGIIGQKPAGKNEFKDFKGVVKSLGAWGGDFVMMATDLPGEYVTTYLRKKDMNTWFRYDDIVLLPAEDADSKERNLYGT